MKTKSNHLLGLETLIKRNMSDLVQNHVDKNIGFVTITDVSLTSDYSYCTIYYSVLDAKDQKRAYDGLNSLQKFFRGEIGRRVTMRKVPTFIFKYDDSFEKGRRIEELLAEIHAKEENKES